MLAMTVRKIKNINFIEFKHHAIVVFEAWECQASPKDGCPT